ncbi:hypothetical protein SIID45300_03001 [Candidatus Magnetaquicoccaceae bacterium FCR-1]|uniref:PH domain-containing protein n=1 Tax=Candidatus Magnetaquiglobus chichijimensis TaxID=3141448 RepID=A0ABQ0CCM6_9PROT
MAGDAHEVIPVNLELLSSDNHVGAMLVCGLAMLGNGLGELMGWGTLLEPPQLLAGVLRPFFWGAGTIVTFLAVRRLLVPGCRALVRINFGGIHDIRLMVAPLRWSFIVEAYQPPGILKYLLRGVVLGLHPDYEPAGNETIWARVFHVTCRLRGKHILFVECGTLDRGPEETLAVIRTHLRARQELPVKKR